MPVSSDLRGRLWAGGIAGGGLLLTHFVSFWLVAPDAHHRAELLHETGHGWWPYGVALGVAAVIAALVNLAVRAARPDRSERTPAATCRFLLPRLFAVQAVGFVGVEAAERVVIGESLSSLLAEPVVLVGLLVQGAVALLVAAFVGLFLVVVRAIAVRLRVAAVRVAASPPRGFLRFPRPRPPVGQLASAPRAPPATA